MSSDALASASRDIASVARARAVEVGCWLLLLAALCALFYVASVHAVAGNADGATVVLEGQDMANGSLALHGWALSLDSFWSVDAIFYAVAVGIVGVHPYLLNLVPAFVAALLVVVVVKLVIEAGMGIARALGLTFIAAMLVVVSPDFAFFLLQGPLHVTTALWCLVAFACLRHQRFDWRFGLGVLLLGTGLLGDFQIAALGVAPVLAGSLVAMVRKRQIRAGLVGVAASLTSLAIGVITRLITLAFGTYRFGSVHNTATAHHFGANIAAIGDRSLQLLGIRFVPIWAMTTQAAYATVVRVVLLVVLLGAVLVALIAMLRACVTGEAGSDEDQWRLDDMLAFAFLADLVVYVVLSSTNGNYSRYLTAAIIFASALAGRVLARQKRLSHVVPAIAGMTLIALIGIGYVHDLIVPKAPPPYAAISAFLLANHLSSGLADYPSSSIITVETDDRARVRPIVEGDHGRLVRFERQSSDAWFSGQTFNFLIYDQAHPWRGVNLANAQATFGRADQSVDFDDYRILIWNKAIHVDTIGSTGPVSTPA